MLEQYFGGAVNQIVNFVIVLTIVVFVHEFGHFYIARKNGVRCQAFSIGFGPELFGFTDKHGTRWKFSLIPLGGYVKMFGEGETMQAVEGGAEPMPRELTPEEKKVSFKHKTVGQRAAIVFAGPGINFLFSILVFWVMFMTLGRPVTEPVIGQVVEGSPAAAAGLLANDRIKSIDGSDIARFEDIRGMVPLSDGSPMRVVIEREGREQSLDITPRLSEEDDGMGSKQKRWVLGIAASENATKAVVLNPVQALGASVGFTYEMVEATFVVMGQMITGRRGTEDLGGPIRIAKYSGEAAKGGLLTFISFVAILSINLGLINLFPVPMLDGGHLLFYAIEASRGRPLSERSQEWGLRVGLALVMALMIFGVWNDIIHY